MDYNDGREGDPLPSRLGSSMRRADPVDTSKLGPISVIHPAPDEFTTEQIKEDHILRYFHYAHLPNILQMRSKPFCDLARLLIDTTPRNPERSVALRKLLEAKDAAVRAHVG